MQIKIRFFGFNFSIFPFHTKMGFENRHNSAESHTMTIFYVVLFILGSNGNENDGT